MIFIIYYYLISLSILGYGFLLSRYLNLNYLNFGFLGFIGLSFLISISYATTLFFIHDYYFNVLVLLIGIFSFLFFYNKSDKNNLIQHLSIFTILIIFILVAKNHDDFPYYHYPYSHFLTQYEHPIGFGHLNNGFRNASSLFFLNSLFFLPKIEFYLLNISPVYFLGFSNIILFNLIFNKKNYKENKLINFISLLSLSFINIFFYRLAEHGTDRSGQILIFLIVILTIIILNYKKNQSNSNSILNLFYLTLILSVLLISLKPFYLIYLPIIFVVFSKKHFRDYLFQIIFSKITFYASLFIFFMLFFNFINSGCLVYPAVFTCFENLYWSFPNETINDVNEWYELWSKAGATPNYIVENQSEYISNFNWVNNWINNYFFNKVSDFLLGLLFLNFIFWLYFLYRKKKIINVKKIEFRLIYIYLIFCTIEWFFKHPALRYGGYQLFALLFFLPVAHIFYLRKINYKDFYKKSWIIIFIITTIFLSRNISRIIKENNQYNYNPFISTKYIYDEKSYNRYIYYVEENYDKFKKIKIFGKNFLITK